MGCEAAKFATLSRFLEKLEQCISMISRRGNNANSVRWSSQEFVWKQILDSVYTKFQASHHREESYRISFSAITEALIQGDKTDQDTLIEACVREHRGQFTKRRGPAPYRGDILEVAAPESPDEEPIAIRQGVNDRIERVLNRLPRLQAELLRRYYLVGPKPSLDELGRLFNIQTRAAVKMRLHRAKKNFSRIYKKVSEDENDVSPCHSDHASPHSANSPAVVGRERYDF